MDMEKIKSKLPKQFRSRDSKRGRNHSVTFIQERLTGDLVSLITERPPEFVSEINRFVSSEKKDEIEEEIQKYDP